jgi:hypothetical protein
VRVSPGWAGAADTENGEAHRDRASRLRAVVAVILLVPLLFLIRKSFGVVSVPVAIALLAVVIRMSRCSMGS